MRASSKAIGFLLCSSSYLLLAEAQRSMGPSSNSPNNSNLRERHEEIVEAEGRRSADIAADVAPAPAASGDSGDSSPELFNEKIALVLAFAVACFVVIVRGHYVKQREESASAALGAIWRASGRSVGLATFGLADLASDMVFVLALSQSSEHRVLAVVGTVAMALPFIAGVLVTYQTITHNKDQLDQAAMRQHITLYSFLILLSATQLEVLSCLPWKSASFDGLPTAAVLKLTYLTVLLEDIPQLCVQLVYAWESSGEHQLILYASLLFTGTSLALRVVSRYVVMVFRQPDYNAPAGAPASSRLDDLAAVGPAEKTPQPPPYEIARELTPDKAGQNPQPPPYELATVDAASAGGASSSELASAGQSPMLWDHLGLEKPQGVYVAAIRTVTVHQPQWNRNATTTRAMTVHQPPWNTNAPTTRTMTIHHQQYNNNWVGQQCGI